MREPEPALILVVDDDEVKRYTMAHAVRRAGFAVVEARTGAEGLVLAEGGVDLIILDVKLPDLSGYEVCRRLKAEPRTATIPVIHISLTFNQSADRAFGLDGGADAYLTDVLNPAELIATIRALLRARRAEEAAREAAEQWRSTFDAITDGVCLLDPANRIVRTNRSAAEILGKPAVELVGRPLGEVLPLSRGDDRASPLALALASGRRRSADVAFYGKRLHVTVDPIRGEGSGAGGSVCILSDVTQQRLSEKAFRESEEHFRLLVEGVRDYAIVMTDPEGRVVSWNPGAERILGYTAPEIVGRSLEGIFTPEDRAASRSNLEMATAAADGRAIDERVHLRKDGSRFWASGVLYALRDEAGRLRGFAKILRDETERKRLEQELRRHADELLAADRQKDQYLAMLAHELRNPLAPIRNALEAIRIAPGDPAEVEAAREIAARQVRHMARLVDDLLDVSRIRSGKVRLRPEPLDLVAVVRQATDAARPFLEGVGLRLEIALPTAPAWVSGDPTRLEQVFANLLNNAGKYTDRGGHVGVAVESHEAPAPGRVVVSIRDTGVGLGQEMLGRVFDLFAQADRSLERAQGGLGIGLTLVKALVEMHSGTIVARSEGADRGSEFVVDLPMIGAPARLDRGSAGRGGPGRARGGRRVLIVDDSVDSATTLAKVLELWGHRVAVAYAGPEGIALATAERFDLILLDIGLPGMDGYEVARVLRGRPEFRETRLVALTGYGQDEDRRRSTEVGFDVHLVKPVDLDALERLIDGVVAGPA